ncbi:SCO family protein [Ornithinibacillus californiensis]|uniref:SCO family protein n=1 Tax=Ornithinibacillus californiensis TaxID=161536 RepID=UPI00064D7DC3|nr:SCO family protein [Ornithinibacillus californiensis]
MNKKQHNFLILCLSIIISFLLFYVGTNGFQAFTAESARVYRLLEEKPSFPDVTLEDSMNRVYPFTEFKGKYVFLTFIYTSCTDVCPQLEMNLAEVYQQVPKELLGEEIVFLSISFDPERDDPATLEKYQFFFNSDGETWRMARITDENELTALLDEFGVIVIPDGYGGYSHNSAFYFVGRDGELLEVMDYKKIDEAAVKVVNTLQNDMEG